MSSLASCPRPPALSSPPFSFPSASMPSSSHPSPNPSPQNNGSTGGDSLRRTAPGTSFSSNRNTGSSMLASASRMGTAVNKIEQIIETVVDNINRGKELSIPFSRRVKPRGHFTSRQRPPAADQNRDSDAARQQPRSVVSFPGKTEAESKLFSGHHIFGSRPHRQWIQPSASPFW